MLLCAALCLVAERNFAQPPLWELLLLLTRPAAVLPMVPLLARLLRCGYQVDVRLLNAAHYGVPQRREASQETTRLSAL